MVIEIAKCPIGFRRMTPDQTAFAQVLPARPIREGCRRFCALAFATVVAFAGIVPMTAIAAGAQEPAGIASTIPTTVVEGVAGGAGVVAARAAAAQQPAPTTAPAVPPTTTGGEKSAPTTIEKPNASGLTTKVTVGAGTRVVWGGPIPVTVSVKAQRLFHGSLRVDAALAEAGWEDSVHADLDIEVAGGATKEFQVELPFGIGRMGSMFLGGFEGALDPTSGVPVPTQAALPAVSVTAAVLTDDGKKADSAVGRGVGSPLGSACVIGDSGPPRGSLPANGVIIKPIQSTLAIARIETDGWSPAVIDGCSQAVISPDVASRLSATWTDGLVHWAEQGNRLVIDGAPADAPANFPAQLKSGGDEQILGVGRVSFSHGLARSGDWERALVPFPTSAELQFDGGASGTTQITLAKLMDFSIPGTKAVVIGILLYIALVGPILFLVLAKLNRQVLAWLLVPLIAVLATVGIVGAAKLSRRDDRSGRVNYVSLGAEHATVHSWIGLPRVGGEEPKVRLKPGARLLDSMDATFGGEMNGGKAGKIGVAVDAAGSDVTASVSENGFAQLETEIVAGALGRLEVSLKREEATGELVGTIRNSTEWDLRKISIVNRGLIADLASLKAGATAPVRIKPQKLMRDQFETDQSGEGSTVLVNREQSMMRSDQDMKRLIEETPFGVMDIASRDEQLSVENVSNVEVWAWTDDAVPSPLSGDVSVSNGPSLIIDRQFVSSIDPLPYSVVSSESGRIGGLGDVIRFDASGDRPDPAKTAILVEGSVGVVPAVWDGEKWVDLVNPKEVPRREPPGGLAEDPAPTKVSGRTVEPSKSTTTIKPADSEEGVFRFPAADWVDPRPVTAWPSNLQYGTLNLWEVPVDGWRDGHLYIRASKLLTWTNPLTLVEVDK